MLCVVDFVFTEHRAQCTEKFTEPTAWHSPYRFARRTNHDGTIPARFLSLSETIKLNKIS